MPACTPAAAILLSQGVELRGGGTRGQPVLGAEPPSHGSPRPWPQQEPFPFPHLRRASSGCHRASVSPPQRGQEPGEPGTCHSEAHLLLGMWMRPPHRRKAGIPEHPQHWLPTAKTTSALFLIIGFKIIKDAYVLRRIDGNPAQAQMLKITLPRSAAASHPQAPWALRDGPSPLHPSASLPWVHSTTEGQRARKYASYTQ